MQDFFPQLPRNLKQPAINLPLLSTQKHLQNPVLNPAAQKKFPFIFHLFSFLPERQKIVGFYVHQTQTGLFLQCITLWLPSPYMNAYLNFHKIKKNNNIALLI